MEKEKYEKAPIRILGLKLSEEVGEVNKEIVHEYNAGEMRANVLTELDQVIWLACTLRDRISEGRLDHG